MRARYTSDGDGAVWTLVANRRIHRCRLWGIHGCLRSGADDPCRGRHAIWLRLGRGHRRMDHALDIPDSGNDVCSSGSLVREYDHEDG